MQQEYIAPELKLVGETHEVVLGSLRVGIDFDSQMVYTEMEFETDDNSPLTSR